MMNKSKVTIVVSADANYFDILKGLILSIKDKPEAKDVHISLLDVGLAPEHLEWAKDYVENIEQAQWDFEFPGRDKVPGHFRALLARPFFPRYFPGYDIYIQIDSDAWVQEWSVIEMYIAAAEKGKLAITPQIDRSHFTYYKRPKFYHKTQNHRCFRWSYGWKTADRLARNVICNAGVFALRGDAPHWKLWEMAMQRGLTRKTLLRRASFPDLRFKLVEQTALNYVIYGDKAPTAFMPSYCNWMCGLTVPKIDPRTGKVVDPNEPHHPLGVIHFDGGGMEKKAFKVKTTDGRETTVMLHYVNFPFFLDEKTEESKS
ncbi:MAG: hypothetical protein OQJ97_12465 [Rhodospirillales bacterium]|nr:hypothetical protein [Rhodospirillales bacterium]